MVASLSESAARTGGFIVSESNGFRSREQITVLSGQNLNAGAVVGRQLVAPTVTPTAKAGNTGTGSIGTVTPGTDVQRGRHTLTVIEPGSNAGVFEVEYPDGQVITGAVAAAFSAKGLAFTLADATDFIAGDQIYIDVTGGTYKFKEWNPANTDGTERVAGILFAAVDASAADKAGVIVARDAEVNAGEILWFSGAADADKALGTDGLTALGIRARTAI